MKHFPTVTNDPARNGELAADKQFFGPLNRYAAAPVHSRFENVCWFVWDADVPGDDYDPIMGYSPAVIRITDSFTKAVAGLA
jgi:hypothetical protein